MFEARLWVGVAPQGKRRIVWGRRNGGTAGTRLAGDAVPRLVSLDAPHGLGTKAVRALQIADEVRAVLIVEGNPGDLVATQRSLCDGEGIRVDGPSADVTDARASLRLRGRDGLCRGHRVLSLAQIAVWYAPRMAGKLVLLRAYYGHPG